VRLKNFARDVRNGLYTLFPRFYRTFYRLYFLFTSFNFIPHTYSLHLQPAIPEKYCSTCPKKLDFSFFLKNRSDLYTPIARIYLTCCFYREKSIKKRKRSSTVVNPPPTTLPRLVTPILGPQLRPTVVLDPPPPPSFGP
jgi:hypothetical protein